MYRFGAFQVDPRAHELRRNGIRIKIQEQSFVVLLKLLEHPGELIPREELRAALWPADTFVDFDTGLNTVIKRLREALRDSADGSLFIETVPKLGYRFIASVEVLTFQNPADYDRIREDDRISLVGLRDMAPGRPVECLVKHSDGTSETLRLSH